MADKIIMAFYPFRVSGFAFHAPTNKGGPFTDIGDYKHLYHTSHPMNYYPEDKENIAEELSNATSGYKHRFGEIDQAYLYAPAKAAERNEGDDILGKAFLDWCKINDIPCRTVLHSKMRKHLTGSVSSNLDELREALAERGFDYNDNQNSELRAMATLIYGMETE